MQLYTLSEDQQALKAAARKFATEVLTAAAARTEAAGEDFPAGLLLEMGNLGFLGLDVPAEYGGQGLDTLSCAAILEELAGGWFSSTIYAMNLATCLIPDDVYVQVEQERLNIGSSVTA